MIRKKRGWVSTSSVTVGIALLLGVLFASLGWAQQPAARKPLARKPAATAATAVPAAEQPKYKGIFEPVNYSEDLDFTDVFFVSADVGWVSGAAGTILKTTDGGQTWTPQLGGDPKSQEPAIYRLRFIDEIHGWAMQRKKLLRTTDGEAWEQIGSVKDVHGDYVFLSETEGLCLQGTIGHTKIWRTSDSGRNWTEVFDCQTKIELEGLRRDVACVVTSLHFPSPQIGYGVGFVGSGVHGALKDILILVKTEDAGATWNLSVVRDIGPAVEVFFADENTGFIHVWQGKMYKTTDGGKRWSARNFTFPARNDAFSLPRRDRGYVAGLHGMIYRYRVVPATEEVAKAILAPAMPGVDSPLDEQVEQLQGQVAALEEEVRKEQEEAAPGAEQAAAQKEEAGGGEAGAQESGAAGSGGSGLVENCCAEKVEQIQATVDAVATEVPKFTGKYRNLNLIFVGLGLVGQLFGQAQTLKDSFNTLRKARDPQSVTAALTELTNQVTGLVQNTKTAFQKQE